MTGVVPQRSRGPTLIIEHCARLSREEHARPAAVTRLRQAIGEDLSRLLLHSLAGDHRSRLRVI
ncbi:MAG TPA: hypothetical protein VFT86_09055 [Gaiellaceae bacterium]|nr:hypothetical protein [Gaiellaceae bacterium]